MTRDATPETFSESSKQRKLDVPAADAGLRLDQFLARACADLSRSRLKALILDGHVTLDGATLRDPAVKLKESQRVALVVPPASDPVPQGQAMDLVVVYEDADVIVIDKPAGLVVHPAAGNADRTLVNALIAHCGLSLSGIGGVRRPGIVHRLDKDTSGLLIAAKNDAAHAGLAVQFADHSIKRVYRAIVWGMPTPPEGEIAGAIGRSTRNRKKMAVVGEGRGKSALTRFRTVRRFGRTAALIECRLETGRTHQIRVHLSHIGHPVVGDTVYGRAHRPKPPMERQALHAGVLGFSHPITKKWLEFESEPPYDFNRLAAWFEAGQKPISES
ncbi:MAG: RluA family pseudouridine synthase [Proteobacteria bacterium]|nr:RluA family pseudouridine synthase [Pseudomonadota bacterium]MDA1058945.1 RluA family pseudouridine synthase [Pseudomonadota bacterium]